MEEFLNVEAQNAPKLNTESQNSPFVENLCAGIRGAVRDGISPDQAKIIHTIWETPYRVDGGYTASSIGLQSIKHYSGYFRRLLSERTPEAAEKFITEIQDLSQFLRQENSSESPLPLLRRISASHEFLALISAHLYGETERIPVLIQGWFTDTLQRLNDIYEKMSEYFSQLHLRAGPTQKLVPSFLDALRDEMEDLLIGAVNMAAIFALHAQEEDCAVYTGTTSYRSKGPAGIHAMNRLFEYPLYQKYNSGMLECHGVHDDGLYIPTYVSAVDIEEFAKEWSFFWQKMHTSITSNNPDRPRIVKIFHPHPTNDAQARIGFLLQGGRLDGLNLRIDREVLSGTEAHLSIDIGQVKWHQAYKHAEDLGQRSQNSEIVMGYKEILNQRGDHAYLENLDDPYPRTQEKYYPSVMRSSLLSIEQKMALIVSVIMRQGKDIGLFQGDVFGYHNRGSRIDHPKFVWNFPKIVRGYSALALSK